MSIIWLILGNMVLYVCQWWIFCSLGLGDSWQYWVSIVVLIAAQAWSSIYTGSNVRKSWRDEK